ncbi:MAG: cysteine hydrolase [Bacteroidetes bacterium]|nr:cysteine hydrolase [Bacteroidota bacterium]
MKEKYYTTENIHEVSEKILDETQPLCGKYPFSIRKNEVALIIVDMQKYFLDRKAHAYIPSGPAIIKNINRLQHLCLENHIPVYLTKHINNKANAGLMNLRWDEIITEDHPFVDLHEAILIQGCKIMKKTQYDAFYGTDLEKQLKTKGVNQVIITGVMTNLCCETTVRSAFIRGFEPVFPLDATAAYNYNFHLSTMINLSYGFVKPILTRQILDEISK